MTLLCIPTWDLHTWNDRTITWLLQTVVSFLPTSVVSFTQRLQLHLAQKCTLNIITFASSIIHIARIYISIAPIANFLVKCYILIAQSATKSRTIVLRIWFFIWDYCFIEKYNFFFVLRLHLKPPLDKVLINL